MLEVLGVLTEGLAIFFLAVGMPGKCMSPLLEELEDEYDEIETDAPTSCCRPSPTRVLTKGVKPFDPATDNVVEILMGGSHTCQ